VLPIVAVAKVVPARLNVTGPVGNPPVLVNVAVNFTGVPEGDGFGADVSDIVIVA
jgi:hypothetical protein